MINVYEQYWYPIINSFHHGETALTPHIGLSTAEYTALADTVALPPIDTQDLPQYSAITLRDELLSMREDELNDLTDLLTDFMNTNQPYAEQMAKVIAVASMGSQHLWKDLGMPERPRLSQLFHDYFPQLHALNNRNMRWKRFLYRQMCERGGDYVCRSPSCETCTSYNECFGDEV
ncbi:nitrogen fixation protein NifQ [Vibrio nitrifigilis]|uniref:Nitrogen fixation protein NifQ n=1 Tax=Vibrio nitrifigilis TaxID=2789781 RepID=A0ABS0GL99_9VIBR|nr:nitrogen fixation protein NifQ [Vibrio nitrifigilis]MBF9002989.1 nitrogen fixation protein NifQ [Vibrio nitrifigilis]